MDHDFARRAIKIFEQVLEQSADTREQFLREACGDDSDLRNEVNALLAELDDDSVTTSGKEHQADSAPALEGRFAQGDELANRYLIENVIGKGGMGEVYRAKDTRLERHVAIKGLNPLSQRSQEFHDRFEREIKAVAALAHPNIVTLYDTVMHAESSFAVMELIAGETLRSTIVDGMTWKSAAQIALGIAHALRVAHERNIIHRDIKPENVMVDEHGIVKVLDFGLAKPAATEDSERITTGAATPGTVPYMSPEQTNGESLDGATDVFSLGTLLYEMLAGVNPFRGDSIFATMKKINAGAPRIEKAVAGLPVELTSLLNSMMHPKANHRPTATDVCRELEVILDLSTGHAPIKTLTGNRTTLPDVEMRPFESTHSQAGRPSIAVLPFQSFTADPNLNIIGDAIAHEIIIELARLHWLLVIARGSSFRFRDPNVDVANVRHALGARYLLTGTVELLGNQGAVTAELQRTQDQQIVWADRFPITKDDLMQMRQKITSNIVVTIESRIQTSEVESAHQSGTANMDAWGVYHRGLWHMYRFDRDDNAKARELFHRAVELDSRFARAYAGLSFTHFQEAFLRFSDDEASHKERTRVFAEKSLELDPLDPFSNLTMGRAAWIENDLDAADTWFGRSLELSPNYAFAWYNRSLNDALRNDGEHAEEGAKKAVSLSPIDPLSYAMYGTIALSHVVRGTYAEAIPWTERALTQPTAHVHMWLIAALVNQLNGKSDTARQQVATIRQMNSSYDQGHFFRAFPFRDPETLSRCRNALTQLGF